MNTEFFVIRIRVPNSNAGWLYYNGGGVGYPGETVPFERAEHFATVEQTAPVLEKMSKARDVAFVHPVVKYGDGFGLEESVSNNLPAPTVELLRTRGPVMYIVALAESFPCLRGKCETITPQNWDVDQWVKNSKKWSHSERAAAMFVALVWNYHGARSKKWMFDSVDALGVWDPSNRAAFLAWAKNPVWP